MSVGNLLNIQPAELKFPFELRKQNSCSIRLTNKSDKCVAFKVKTTNPKKYCVRPNLGTIVPGSSCNVTVTMQAPKETPSDMQCKDKFLIQSIVAPDGANSNDITTDTFVKVDGKVLKEFKLRVVYIPANPPSPVPEGSEEELSPRSPVLSNGNPDTSSLEAAWSTISKLTEEKATAMQQKQQLEQELEDLVKKQAPKNRVGGLSLMTVLLVCLLSILAGYLVTRMYEEVNSDPDGWYTVKRKEKYTPVSQIEIPVSRDTRNYFRVGTRKSNRQVRLPKKYQPP